MNIFNYFFISALTLIGSCHAGAGDEYELLDPSAFNQRIINDNIFTTVEGLLQLYYLNPKAKSFPKIKLSSENYEGAKWRGVLIDEDTQDSAIAGTKIVMYVESINNKWVVQEIRRSFKCNKGKGHQDWGANPCK